MNIFEHWDNLTRIRFFQSLKKIMLDMNLIKLTSYFHQLIFFVEVAAVLSRYELPKEAHYRYLYNKLAKTYLKTSYPKAKNSDQDDEKWVAKYFEFGTKDTKDAMKILTKEDIRKIKKKYGILK